MRAYSTMLASRVCAKRVLMRFVLVNRSPLTWPSGLVMMAKRTHGVTKTPHW